MKAPPSWCRGGRATASQPTLTREHFSSPSPPDCRVSSKSLEPASPLAGQARRSARLWPAGTTRCPRIDRDWGQAFARASSSTDSLGGDRRAGIAWFPVQASLPARQAHATGWVLLALTASRKSSIVGVTYPEARRVRVEPLDGDSSNR